MARPGDTRGRGRGTFGSTVFKLFFVTVVVGILGFQAASSSAPSVDLSPGDRTAPITEVEKASTGTEGSAGTVDDDLPPLGDFPPGDDGDATAEAITLVDGALPGDATVFDDVYPGVAHLDPDLLQALRIAARAASGDGISFQVNSGWRSPEYQNYLLGEAASEYGSEEEAARWVATAETSAHVSGEAVDIGPDDAQAWLAEHGSGYGLCQIYANEPWHYELRPQATDRGCPNMYPDPTHDPRMQN